MPRPYDALIPRWLPGSSRTWTYGSGVVEIGSAALVATPRTRRLGGLVAAALFLVVLPANVQACINAQRDGSSLSWRVALLARLPLQLPLVAWAMRVRREA